MKKITISLFVIISCISSVAFPLATKAYEVPMQNTVNYNIFYQDTFDAGLSEWTYENTTTEKNNGNRYAFLKGYTDRDPWGGGQSAIGAIQRKLSGAIPGGTYTFSIKAIGIGAIALNSSGYQIRVDDGYSPVDISKAKTYSTSVKADNDGKIAILILAYGTKLAVDDIKIYK